MEKEIKILMEHYGGRKAVSKLLDITPRHLLNIVKGKHIGKHLRRIILLNVRMVE